MNRHCCTALILSFALFWTPLACPQPAASADEDHDWGIAPTQQLRRAPYSAPTPREIPGAQVVRTPALKQMLEGGSPPLLIDVASGDGHDSIQGTVWLPGAGRGANFVDALQGQFAERLERLTGGDKARPLVFFCVNTQCWLSYNASLRAAALGYAKVYWYRGGIEAWRLAGLPLARVQPAPQQPLPQ